MKYKVLLVDDEKRVLQSLFRVLHGKYEIVTAKDGFEGLSKIQSEQNIAVVITDQKMPGMDGVEFLTKVREESPDTVRIILSGYRDFDVSIRAVNEGKVFRFLSKPFPSKNLIEVLEIAIEQFELNREISNNANMRDLTQNMLSVCSFCKKVREKEKPPQESESWERIELFLSRQFGFRFSHCVCPDCVGRLRTELEEMKQKVSDSIVIGSEK
ncbi:MAG: response regulator [Candidatus Cloacimonetes bacterium]|nr:response regulator [Candidatus Cloacimonadota bacterium]